MQPEVFVVTAAYGNDNVMAMGGQGALLPMIAQSGAAGVEIRRELLTAAELRQLPELARAIAGLGLRCFYSAPQALFAADGLTNDLLPQLFDEAQQLGAERLKLSLGQFTAATAIAELAGFLATQTVKLMVENDQTDCGALAPLHEFFTRVGLERLPIGMTFDMGNWHWVGQDPQPAAAALAAAVTYIHVKVAAPCAGGWAAVPPDAADPRWHRLLAELPDNVPRGIEFPLAGADLPAVTQHYVALLQQPGR